MPRARNIKPSFFANETLAELPALGRLLFIGMWTIADYKGCIEYRAKRIKVQLLPYDDCEIDALTNNLERSGFISMYSVQGQQYIKITNFEKHQNPHKNERQAGSEIPDIPENYYEIKGLRDIGLAPDKNGTAPADSLFLIPPSPIPPPAKPNAAKKPRTGDADGFEEFWNAWPKSERKQDRTRCHATWAINGYGEFKAQIMADIETKRQTEKWRGGYIEAPLVYLHNERWKDGVTPDGPGGVDVREWHESAAGVDAKAQELGLAPCASIESRPAFKNRVLAALRALHTEPLQLTLSELMARRPQGMP